jgi:uncharacterized protein YndB with AHSA1/START domain
VIRLKTQSYKRRKGAPEMSSKNEKIISIQATIDAPVEMVWKTWTTPQDIMKWNSASDDWHTPNATNDLKTGGTFRYRMEAKEGSIGFDFYGVYTDIRLFEYIEYTLGDGRKVNIVFTPSGNQTSVVESFEPENTHSIDQQRNGWQAILNNFKMYTEEKQHDNL